MRNIRRLRLAAAAILIALAAVRAAAQIPEKFTNLQVLPKDITRQNLVPIMRGFALQLGVRCEHCHVGEGNDLSRFDFASDARPAKATARRMLAMVTAINDTWLAGVGEATPTGAPRVTCFTCHRGVLKPASAGGAAYLTTAATRLQLPQK